MALFMENYGLDFFLEDDDTFRGFVGYIVQEGKAINSYYGTPYFFKSMNDVEFWVSTEKNEEGNLSISGVESHCGGFCVWDVTLSGIDITPKDSPKTQRSLMIEKSADHNGLLPINIITADVLPSFLEGDKFRVQVIAQPLWIRYYSDENEYVKEQPKDKYGKRWTLAEGALLPVDFLNNHAPKTYEDGKDYDSDLYVQFMARVKHLYQGRFELNGECHNLFIRCIAETSFGELEFDHTFEQVPEEQRNNIKVGSIISGICVISGDVAINEYENGFIRDFDHDLLLLRYSFIKGEAERLRSVLSEDAVYLTDNSTGSLSGPDEIINKFNKVHEKSKKEIVADLATITESGDTEYPVGTRCIVLAYGKGEDYSSIAFLNTDENGMIIRIKISNDSSFRFKTDLSERENAEKANSPLADIIIPESPTEMMIIRAKFRGLISFDTENENIIGSDPDYRSHEQNIERMLAALENYPQADKDNAVRNIFGYLFAKSMEETFMQSREVSDCKSNAPVFFSTEEAVNGKFTSTLSERERKRLELAMELGMDFYNDYRSFADRNEMDSEECSKVLKESAIVVQRIGQMGAEKFMQRTAD